MSALQKKALSVGWLAVVLYSVAALPRAIGAIQVYWEWLC